MVNYFRYGRGGRTGDDDDSARKRRERGHVSRAQGEAAKDAAMEQVDAAANEAWKMAADHAVIAAARELPTFTTDAVVPLIDPNTHTHDLRALGPRMLAAARAGVIEKAYELPRPTPRRHMTPLTVWRSLIYRRIA